MSFVLLSALVVPLARAAPQQWEYDEQGLNVSHWAEDFPECAGERQSPIDVIFTPATTGNASSQGQCVEPLLLHYETELQHFAVRNTGHSIQAIPFEIRHEGGSELSGLEILHHTNDTAIRLSNSFYNTYEPYVNKEYCFDSLHFHWGETNEYGSEHTLNGQFYPLEVHLVHYSCDYFTVSDAVGAYKHGEAADRGDDQNVLAVVGVLFEIGEANPVLEAILDDYVINKIRYYEDAAEYANSIEMYYTEFDLDELIPDNKEMVSYLGSLTTPPCLQTVRWHVMKNTMTVSLEQMVRFRMILESTDLDDNMAPNWRPVQKLNGRTLYECQETVDAEALADKEEVHDVAEEEAHDSQDVLHLEVEGSMENLMWIGIGVAFIIICYLTYIIHCKESNSGHHGQNDAQELDDSVSDNLVDITEHDI